LSSEGGSRSSTVLLLIFNPGVCVLYLRIISTSIPK